jgi:hypothetical protein
VVAVRRDGGDTVAAVVARVVSAAPELYGGHRGGGSSGSGGDGSGGALCAEDVRRLMRTVGAGGWEPEAAPIVLQALADVAGVEVNTLRCVRCCCRRVSEWVCRAQVRD